MNNKGYETVEMKVYNDIKDISKEKIEEYKNSPQWIELDDLFKKITSENISPKSALIEILSYGEIVRVKFDHVFNNIQEGMVLTSEFIYLPLFMDMPHDLAVAVIKGWGSDDEEINRKSSEIILDYQRDRKIEDLIEILKNARLDNNHEVANGAMGELYRIGEYVLPRLRLVRFDNETPQNLLDDTTTIIFYILIGEEKTNDLMSRCADENEDIWIPAQEEVRNIIDKIDLMPYFFRHPEKLEKMKEP